MADGALGSDHINYLILRYLQEAGHENAAKALYQDWHRADEFQDPEKLPFARQVKQFELVGIIQDGLFLDQVQAQVTKQTPRFSFADPYRQSPAQKHPHPSRRRSSQNQRSEQDEFPIPAPKRVRKSNGDDQVNGDAMEVDSKTPNTAGDDGRSDDVGPSDTDRATSEALERAQSVSPAVPAIEVLNASTQTDAKTKTTKSQTIYWTVDKEEASILHAKWNPKADMSRSLLAIGDSLCRFYQLPSADEGASTNGDVTPRNQTYSQQAYFDAEDMPANSIATAACWHPTGQYATCSIEIRRTINNSEESLRVMFDTAGQEGLAKRLYNDNAYINVLQRSGPTVTGVLQYNEAGSRLMSVSMNVKRGLLEIWEAGSSEDPIAVKIFPSPVNDAVWVSDDIIIISGDSRLESYRIELPSDTDMADNDSSDAFTSTGARNLSLLHSFETDKTWDRVQYDAESGVLAAVSTSDEAIVAFHIAADNSWKALTGLAENGGAGDSISALAFESASSTGTRLATAHHTGKVKIYNVTADSCTPSQTLSMSKGASVGQEAALSLSWSPNGKYLAVASEDGVRVWNPTFPYSPLLEWKAEYWEQSDGVDNGGRDLDRDSGMGDSDSDVHVVNEPSLAWDSLGEKLSFAVGRRMAVVRLLL